MKTGVKKILIIKLGAIGDVLMATPSFEAIRSKYPGAKIHLLVGNWSKDVVINNPNIDEIISIDENIFWKKRLFSLIKLFFMLRNKRFDIVYVMHWSNLFNLFVFLLGIKERIGFKRVGGGKFLTRKVPFEEGKEPHTIYKYLSLVNDDIQRYNNQMKIYLTTAEIEFARNELTKCGLNFSDKIIGIAPGGGENPKIKMFTKRWPVEHFIDLIDIIYDKLNLPVILFGAGSDLQIAEKIISFCKSKRCILNFVGKTNLRETAALMSLCSLVITNDSGLLHLAASVGTKTISIFGPTAPYDKVPIDGKHRYLYKAYYCSPCYRYGKFPNCKERKCLVDITPMEVYKGVETLFL